MDSGEGARPAGWIGDAQPVTVNSGPVVAGIGALNQAPPRNIVTVTPYASATVGLPSTAISGQQQLASTRTGADISPSGGFDAH